MYTAESTGPSMDRTKMPHLRNVSKGGFEPGLSRLRVWHSTTELPRSMCDFFFFFWLLPPMVVTDFPSPFVPIAYILLRHFRHSIVLSHRIHKPPVRPSLFPLFLQLHHLHPLPNAYHTSPVHVKTTSILSLVFFSNPPPCAVHLMYSFLMLSVDLSLLTKFVTSSTLPPPYPPHVF